MNKGAEQYCDTVKD